MTFRMKPGWDKRVTGLAVTAAKQRFQPILDGIYEELAGQPVEVIKPILAQRWVAASPDASITEPRLTTYAQTISDGKRIVLRG